MGVGDSFLSPVAGKLGEKAASMLLPPTSTNEVGQVVHDEIRSLIGTSDQRERALELRRHQLDLGELDLQAERDAVVAWKRKQLVDRALFLGIGVLAGWVLCSYFTMRRKPSAA